MQDKNTDKKNLSKILADNKERLKELMCINTTTNIIKEKKSIEETLKHIALILPNGWQFPENTYARITYDEKKYDSKEFQQSEWVQSQSFETIVGKKGEISVFYDKKFSDADEGPFLNEERDLINNLANIISGYISSFKGEIYFSNKKIQEEEIDIEEDIFNHQLLHKFISKHNSHRDVYHDLMPFKVKEILLVANLYDAYIMEAEGRFTEHILGEYYHLNLTSTPRITGVSTNEEAIKHLKNKHYDLVILMMGIDKKTPIELSRLIKSEFPYIQTYLLLNNNLDIALLKEDKNILRNIDKHFIWNGESKIFFTMIKLLEDKVNVENDTNLGMTRVILLVEDSSKYYSRYLPVLYKIILEQTRLLIEEVTSDELYKILKMRARPKILLASNFEEAVSIYEKYKEYLLCVISDVHYPYNGGNDDEAGIQLIKYVKKHTPNIPTVLQSSEASNAKKAFQLNSTFIDKNSESLAHDLKSFISHFLGFGNFIYRDKSGRKIATAHTLREFEKLLQKIPAESLIYHGQKNHFSLWLMARGEIQIAKIVAHYEVKDFENKEEIRGFLIKTIQQHRFEQDKGKVVPFEETAINDETNIVSLAPGALGGKGRGIAFINTLIYNFDLSVVFPDINITSPKTSIIGTEEFDNFIERNHLREFVIAEKNYDKIKQKFIEGKLTTNLTKNLKVLLKNITKPIAVRSSSLFEDSLMQPFSGIFATYLLPNNHEDSNVRLQQLSDAIKLVYASIYSTNAKTYFEAVNYKIEEEKMAIVIQEVVGNEYDDCFYPHISGTAQSHNYYPVSHMQPDEGFGVLAVGLGTYVVEGERTFRFSPKYPQIEISSQKDIYKSSQIEFFAIDMKKKELKLTEGEEAALIRKEITDAKEHGTIKHCASIYDFENDRIVPGLSSYGPIVVNFANIMRYNYIPLAETISSFLDIIREALGSPVEIEYAVNLNKDKDGKASFYLLQIKPLVGNENNYNIDVDEIKNKDVILYTEKSMGNGKIDNVQEMIYVKPNMFDNTKTLKMAAEIEVLNKKMMKEKKKYILIGPGRWGSRDQFIGIPVVWPQICNAKVIIETSLENFPLDASLGSHFFHNVTSMNVGYFTVQHSASSDIINWDIIEQQELIEETTYFKRVRFKKNINVVMDGKKQISVILWEN